MRQSRDESQYYLEVIDEYKRLHGVTTYELRDVISWAVAAGRLEMPPDVELRWHMERASQAQRGDVARDRHGRKWRLRHVVKVLSPERYIWGHVDDAPDDFLQEAIRQRLESVRKDFAQIEADVEHIASVRPQLGQRLSQMLINFDIRSDGYSEAGGA